MEDTTRESWRLIHDVVMSKTVEERFLMCAEMYDEAKEFAKIGMPEGLSQTEQEVFVFRRIYGMSPIEMIELQ